MFFPLKGGTWKLFEDTSDRSAWPHQTRAEQLGHADV